MKYILPLIMISLVGCNAYKRLIDGRPSEKPVPIAELRRVGVIGVPAQSNGVGRGENKEYPKHPRVTITRDLQTGPFYYAATLLADAHPDWHITLGQCGEGGTSIDRWVPGGDRYERCLAETKALQAQGIEIIALFGYQGEANARENAGFDPLWPRKFEMLIASFRSSIGVNAPLVWARLGQLNLNVQAFQDNWALFKANQLTVSIPNSKMIETEDQPTVDDVHHGFEANKIIGERFYRALGL